MIQKKVCHYCLYGIYLVCGGEKYGDKSSEFEMGF